MANAFYEAEPGENVSANATPVRRFFHQGREVTADELPMQYASLTNSEARDMELDVLLPSGRWLNMLGSASPLHDSMGNVRGCVGTFMDITIRKQAEEALQELTQRLTYHVDNSPLAVIEWGSDMRLTRWSGEAERIFGWTADEVLGKRMEDFRWIYPEDETQVAVVSGELQTGANPHRFSANRNYHKDGSVIHCEWYNSSLLDDTGQLRSITPN